MGIEFRLLGEVDALLDGRPIDVGHARQRCVLAALLVDADRPVGADELVDRAWADRPPQHARSALSGYVSRLRSVLAADPDIRLERRGGGYQLTVDPATVDLHRFTGLLGQAERQRADGRPGTHRLDLLTEALELWRGPALGEFDTPWANAQRSALDAARHAATLDRNDLALEIGRHKTMLADLLADADAHPLDERLTGQLMLALYRCGRQADALRRYLELRRALAEELGADPGPALQELHRKILAADPELAWIGTRQEAGGRPVPHHLPAAPQTFTGRRAELVRLDDAADAPAASAVVTVVSGTAGVGKTALALHWAHQCAARFPDGQLYVDLRGFDPSGAAVTPTAALHGFLDALGVPPERIPADLAARAGLYRSLLAGRRMLVLLDNARDADQVTPLIPGTAGCVVVITSRSRLAGLVAHHGARIVGLGLLSAAAAREMLIQRVGLDRVEAEPAAAADIVTRCGGLPLALAVIGARAAARPEFPLSAVVDELRRADRERCLDAFDFGTDGAGLSAVLSASYRALPAETARMLRMLGLSAGPDIAVETAASLAGRTVRQTGALLADLAEAHLVTEHQPGRYGLHGLLRTFAAALVADTESTTERHAAIRRMLDHYLHMAYDAANVLAPDRDRLDLAAPTPGALPAPIRDVNSAVAWLTAERANLLAAVTQAVDAGLDAHAWQLSWSLMMYLDRRGHWHDQAATHRIALAAAERLGDGSARAYAHRALAYAYTRLGDDQARHHFEQALALYGGLGDHHGLARTYLTLGWLAEAQGCLTDAIAHAQRAHDHFAVIGHDAGRAAALNNIGWHHALIGEPLATLTHCRQALAIVQEQNNRHGEATTWDSIGYAHHQLGEHDQAIECYHRAAELLRGEGDRYGEAATLTRLGDIQLAAGDEEAAVASWRAAYDILDLLDHPEADDLRARLDKVDRADRTTIGAAR